MIVFIYTCIAAGVAEKSDSYLKGICWPYHVGMIIGDMIKQRESRKSALKS